MVIEKVHGLHATSVSLNDRFTMLGTAAPVRPATRARRRTPFGARINHNTNIKNQALIDQIARRLEWQAKRRALRQRLGVGPGALRRFGSESSLPGLRRTSSFSNISQTNSGWNRSNWRGSNGNLSRSASFGNLSQATGRGRGMRRGFKRRGGGDRALRGRFRGGVRGGRVTRVTQRQNVRGAVRGRGAPRGRGGRGGQWVQGAGRGGSVQGRGGATRGRGGAARGRGGAMRGRGQGGMRRPNQQQPVPSREELDLQLDQYMANTKSALDKELDAYMKNAMDME